MKRNIIIAVCVLALCGGVYVVLTSGHGHDNDPGELQESSPEANDRQGQKAEEGNSLSKGQNPKKVSGGEKPAPSSSSQGKNASKQEKETSKKDKEPSKQDKEKRDISEAVPVKQGSEFSMSLIETTMDMKEWEGKIKDFLDRAEKIPRDAEDYGTQLDAIKSSLGEVSSKDLAIVLNNLVVSKTGEERWDMLEAVNALLLDERFFDGLPNEDAEEIKGILRNIVGSGLSDSDSELRLYSLDMLERLPEDLRLSMYGVVLSYDYADAKEKLLQNHAGSDEFQNLALFFQALDSPDAQIAQMARENIQNVLNQDFKSTKEAFEWWEQKQKEGGVNPGTPVEVGGEQPPEE